MKKTILVLKLSFFTIIINAQWNNSGDNTTTGKVGIGISNPSEKLQINGNSYIKGGNLGVGITNPYAKLHVLDEVNGAFNGIVIDNKKTYGANSGINQTSRMALSLSENNHNALNRIFGLIEAGTISETSSANGRLSFYVRKNGTPDEKVRIDQNGNVGIGTTNPQHGKLHINGNGSNGGINLWTDSGNWTSRIWIDDQNETFHLTKGGSPTNGITINNSGFVGIGITNPSASLHVKSTTNQTNSLDDGIGLLKTLGGDYSIQLTSNNGTPHLDFANSSNEDYDIRLGVYHDNKLAIIGGNVGIGTINPDSELSVNRKIHTKEVKVDLIGWSDFVFEKEYDLPTLAEVEQHIKEKGHLQDIPSAVEVEKNGILLGKMNAKLLQKIEELTLYTIQQQSEIKELKKENKEIKNLLKRVSAIEEKLKNKN